MVGYQLLRVILCRPFYLRVRSATLRTLVFDQTHLYLSNLVVASSNTVFFKCKIVRDGDFEVRTDNPRRKLINVPPNKDFFKLILTLDNYDVTKVGIKFMHNLSDKSRNVGYGGTQPLSSTNF